jgi:oligopeptide transport system substrate-binding protein
VDLTSNSIITQLMVGLTTINAENQVVPSLASHWELSPDQLTYRFHLRPTARWSNGQGLTAHDVVFAWQRALNPSQGCAYAIFFFPIHQAKAYYEGHVKDFAQVGVKALDAHTLEVKLDKPLAFFPSLLASPVMFPLPKAWLQQHPKAFTSAENTVSNGPYRLKTWKHEESILLEPNPTYWDVRPQRPAVLFRMIPDANTSLILFETGQLDMVESGTSLSAVDYRRFVHHPWAQRKALSVVYYLGFNTRRPPLNNPNLRKAFCHCVDKTYFGKLLNSGQSPISSFLTPELPGFDPTVGLKYDVAAGQRALAQFKTETPQAEAALSPTQVWLGFRNNYDTRKAAEILQYQWQKALGLSLPLRQQDWKVYLRGLQQEAPPLFLLTWYVDYPDPDSDLNLFTSQNGNNYTQWKNKTYDALIEKALHLPNGPQRWATYTQAQRLFLEQEAAVCPLFQVKKLWLTHPRVKGLTFNSLNQLFLDDVVLTPANALSQPSGALRPHG